MNERHAEPGIVLLQLSRVLEWHGQLLNDRAPTNVPPHTTLMSWCIASRDEEQLVASARVDLSCRHCCCLRCFLYLRREKMGLHTFIRFKRLTRSHYSPSFFFIASFHFILSVFPTVASNYDRVAFKRGAMSGDSHGCYRSSNLYTAWMLNY